MNINKIIIGNDPISIYNGLAFEQILFLELINIAKDSTYRSFLFAHNNTLKNISSNPYSVCYIWRSLPAVVLGRNQNPLKESNILFLKTRAIDLARRDSGGGTVYQDINNLNFCVISANEDRVTQNLQLIINSLHRLGCECTIDSNNNIRLGADKISGSAYRYNKKIQLHHFTLLLSSDLENLRHALHPLNNFTLHSKGIESKRTTVANLGIDTQVMIEAFVQESGIHKAQIEHVPKDIIQVENTSKSIVDKHTHLSVTTNCTLRETFQGELARLRDVRWIYGRSPVFSIEIVVSTGKYRLEVEKGMLIAIYEKTNNKNDVARIIWEGKEDFFSKIVNADLSTIKKDLLNAIIENIIITKKGE